MSYTARFNDPGLPIKSKRVRRIIDLVVTLTLWFYFTFGFVVLFAPFYFLSSFFPSRRRQACQRVNHHFYQGFFLLCRLLMPRQKWRIDPAVKTVRSAVVVSNHISYIDSIWMISLFARHTTIVKNRLLKIPVLGWVLNLSGYLPADATGRWAAAMVERVERLPAELAAGANLIVFPEGTRSRTGAVGPLNIGAFKLARLCRAPVVVLNIRNTDQLFTPGQFLFNTCKANTIEVSLLARIEPDYDSQYFSVDQLAQQVHSLFKNAARL